MKHDHKSFGLPQRGGIAGAYQTDAASRIRAFLPMVRRLAWHVNGAGRPGVEVEDLIQAGLVALTECAQRHAGPGEDGFAAYAKMRVRGAMVDLIRRTVPLSRGASERRRLLRDAEQALRTDLGREPTSAELAQALGMDEGELDMLRSSQEPLRFESIDEVYSDHSMWFADVEAQADETLDRDRLQAAVAEAIRTLPERDAMVMQLYFVEEMNLEEIGQTLGVGAARVCQIKKAALDKMRLALKGWA